jgi:outer membrane protein assembly factor BamB
VALNENDGSLLWANTDAPGGLATAAANGTIFEVWSSGVTAMDATTGATVWSNPTGEDCTFNCAGTVAVANGVLYLADGALVTIDTATGVTISSSTAHPNDGVAVANGYVYTGTLPNGQALYAYSTNSGS